MKIYYSKITNLKIKFGNEWVRFMPSEFDGIGYYVSKSKEYDKFIESLPMYGKGNDIWLHEDINEEVEDVVVEQPQEDENQKSFPEVISYQKAVGVLVKDFGVNRKEITNKETLIEKAKELGVEFPNL